MAIAIGCAASLYVLTVQRRDEARAGSVALAAVSWRRFIGMLLQAMCRRGYVQAVDLENAAGDRDHMLQRDGARWLLPCTQASTSVPDGDVTCVRSASSRRSPDEQPVALSWTCPALAGLGGSQLWPTALHACSRPDRNTRLSPTRITRRIRVPIAPPLAGPASRRWHRCSACSSDIPGG